MDILIKSLIIFGAVSTIDNLSCKDEGKNDVDMFIIYKLPKIPYEPEPSLKSGKKYIYLDSNKKQFRFATGTIDDQSNPLEATLNPIYSDHKNLLYGFYNDEYPHRTTHMRNGHTKGVLAFSALSGFWLLHSIPNFPPDVSQNYEYPLNGFVNAQMIICVSFKFAQIKDIVLQLQYNNPHIHSHNMPARLIKGELKLEWEKLVKGICVEMNTEYIGNDIRNSAQSMTWESCSSDCVAEPSCIYWTWISKTKICSLKNKVSKSTTNNGAKSGSRECVDESKIIDLKSAGGAKYRHYATRDTCDKDIYELVAGDLNRTLYAETWLNGKKDGLITNNVVDLDCINIHIPGNNQFNFRSTKDHSKFAFEQTGSPPYVCIGDINRTERNLNRSGGTMCFEDMDIWNEFERFKQIATEKCGKQPKKRKNTNTNTNANAKRAKNYDGTTGISN